MQIALEEPQNDDGSISLSLAMSNFIAAMFRLLRFRSYPIYIYACFAIYSYQLFYAGGIHDECHDNHYCGLDDQRKVVLSGRFYNYS